MSQTCETVVSPTVDPEVLQLQEQIHALEQLLEVYEQETLEKSEKLEQALSSLQEQAQQLSISEARFRKLAQRREVLNRLTQQIRQSLDVATVVETAVSEIRQFLNLEAGLFWWYHPEDASFALVCENWHDLAQAKATWHPLCDVNRSHIKGAHLPELQNLLEHVAECPTGEHGLPYPESSWLKELYTPFDQLMLPVRTRSGRTGVMHCLKPSCHSSWHMDELELLQEVISQLAIALDQAELYEQSCLATTQAQAQAEQLTKALLEIQKTPQLVQTEKMASLGQLVAGVAHEINNPVNFIHGNLVHASQYIFDLLEMVHLYQAEYPHPTPVIEEKAEDIDLEFLKEDLPKLFNSMQVGAERIREIVRSLRTFSRLDEAEIKGVDIHEGLDSTLMLLQSHLKAKSDRPAIQVVKQYAQLPEVYCYAGQLNQVFMNILVNAIDALEESFVTGRWSLVGQGPQMTDDNEPVTPPTITIQTQQVGEFVQIAIADNGPGMTDVVKQRLFDPFFTTKSVGKGTGLGMSISYQIVTEAHQGELTCQSELGQGTEFVIRIPLQQKQG